jgi:hypothetical protein
MIGTSTWEGLGNLSKSIRLGKSEESDNVFKLIRRTLHGSLIHTDNNDTPI